MLSLLQGGCNAHIEFGQTFLDLAIGERRGGL